jgi:acetyl-CoA decarbonylase/synthase complex subunit delta
MAEKGNLKMNEMLSDYNLQSLEGIIMEGDIEMDLELSCGAWPLIMQSLGREFINSAANLLDLSRSVGYPVDSLIKNAVQSRPDEF